MSEREDLWYFDLKTHQVARGEGLKAEDRLGPYQTREEAAAALEKVRARNEAWDNDPRWNDDEDDQDA